MKKKTIIRIIEWVILVPLFYYGYAYSNQELNRYLLEELEVPRRNIVHVDEGSVSNWENGSFEHPFRKIGAALDFIENNNSFRTILVAPGEYEEALVLPDNINLFGFQGVPTIKGLENSSKIITPGNENLLTNIRVVNGKYGIYIPKDNSVTINNVLIESSARWGIYNEKHSEIGSARLWMINSKVRYVDNQGLYLQKGTFYMNNSVSSENGEEGVDLHVEMKSVIKNSLVLKNGEGGLETELGNIDLYIENSTFRENGSSGVNLQSAYNSESKVVLKNNIIEKNKDFGIRCAIHSDIDRPYFPPRLTIEESNQISENGKEGIAPYCSSR